MDALALIPEHARSDPYWNGSLSMALVLTLNGDAQAGKRTLNEFLASPLPSRELREMLKEEMKRG